MALSWRFSAVTDIGRTRKKNDDSGYAGPHLIMVADGMGGAPAGDLASAVAVQTMLRLDAPPHEDMLEALAGALLRANDRLAELIEEDPSVAGMGTTVTAALFDGERIGVAHLGDSRGYLWRDGELLRVTRDHTWVQSLIDDGRITEDQAKVHSHRSLLLKVLDGRNDHDPELMLYDVQPGDRVLICSDGLSGFVEHDRIERVLSIGAADTAARELTQLALEGGSNDNITVVVADIVDEPTANPEPILVGAVAAQPRRPSRRRTRAQAPTEKSLMADPTVDPEELRYAPRPPRRFLGLRRLAVSLVALGVIGAVAVVAYNWSQQQYYVASNGGQVAIYQGLQADLPGVELHHVYESQDLMLTELPSFRRSQVIDGLEADDLAHAHLIVDKLVTFARTCVERASSAAATATSSPTSTVSPDTEDIPTTQGTSRRPPSPTSRDGANPTPSARSPANPPPKSSATTATPSRELEPVTSAPGATDATAGASRPEECAGASPVTETTR